MKLEHLDTPALFIDAKVLQQNIAAMDELLKGSALKLRPHSNHTSVPFLHICRLKTAQRV